MNEQQIVLTLATKVMGWKELESIFYEEAEAFPAFYINDGMCCVVEKQPDRYIDYVWNPLENINDAWRIADKLGICAIPQSAEDGFRWYACDIESVSYRGEEISIRVKGDTGYSKDTAQEAICYSALEVVKTL